MGNQIGATRNAGRTVQTIILTCVLALFASTPLQAGSAFAATEETDLADLDIEDLFDLEVTSLSKRSQRLTEAAAAIYVVSGDDIRRSGMRTIPEALRMVPGLQVSRLSGNRWAINARGFNSIFSDKMLVMIDGRAGAATRECPDHRVDRDGRAQGERDPGRDQRPEQTGTTDPRRASGLQ